MTAGTQQGRREGNGSMQIHTPRLHVGADVEQVLRHGDVAGAGRLEEGRLPAGVPALDLRALVQEQLDHLMA
eukprot:9277322-Alexandrium_andersonii.AAC.1